MRVPTYDNRFVEVDLPEGTSTQRLLALPALVDPHVHFRVPGGDHKEDWASGARAAIAGGVTTVFDMPNNTPAITTVAALRAKKNLIDEQLNKAGIQLRYKLWFGASADNINELEVVAKDPSVVGIKLFMGASTGNLLVADEQNQAKIFEAAAKLGLTVAVHAEDEATLKAQSAMYPNPSVLDHSKIRDRKAAVVALEKAIALAARFGTKVYILHLSTAEEVALVRRAKQQGVKIFAEVTPHHLFLNETALATLGTLAQMNPPLRTARGQEALWQAIADGTIDCFGTDHAPHTLAEKQTPYPGSPSGVPGIETMLPLLLNAYHENKITLEKIVGLTSLNPRRIFGLPNNNDWAIVNLALAKEVKNRELKTKCGWSPFNGWRLTGWPVYTILNGKTYSATGAK